MDAHLKFSTEAEKRLRTLAEKRGITVEALIVKATNQFVGAAYDDAYRQTIQEARDSGFSGPLPLYLDDHPGAIERALR